MGSYDEIPMGDGRTKRIYSDGSEQVVDAEGKFSPGGKLSPERASAIKQGRTKKRSTATLDEVEDLLSVLPEDLLEDQRREWLIRQAASGVVVGGAGSAAMLKELLGLVSMPRSSTPRVDNLPDSVPCPYCGRKGQPTLILSDRAVSEILALMSSASAPAPAG